MGPMESTAFWKKDESTQLRPWGTRRFIRSDRTATIINPINTVSIGPDVAHCDAPAARELKVAREQPVR
jgi:hypothetical protein